MNNVSKVETVDFKAFPVHPGRTLKNELEVRNISANELALKIMVPANRILGIIHEERNISLDTALRLGMYFGNSGLFWANLQNQYDYACFEFGNKEKIIKEVIPIK